jgi:ATP-dependent protease ClpP protease subunit
VRNYPTLMAHAVNLGAATNRAATRMAYGWQERTSPCFLVENAAAETAKLYVYDILDAAEFVQAVHGITAKSIDLHINSPGGFVYDAVAMFEAVKGHPAEVSTHIDGLAASAASFLAMAGDAVDIAKGGRVMIHDAQGLAFGSPADMHEYGDLLSAISDDISVYYADRAGGKPASWRAAMTATTWYSAQQSVDAGLVDRIAGAQSDPETESTTDSGADNRTRLIQARHRALTAPKG